MTAPHIQALVTAAKAVCDNAETDDEDFGISAVDSGDLKALKSALDALESAPPSPADGEWQRVGAEHPLPSDYDHELALMLWPFTNAKELAEDKFAKVARKSFAAFTRDHHQDCMAAWKAYCGKRQSPAYRRNTAPPKSE